MSHLSIERLAALADEQPDVSESEHLARCAECARELDAIRSLVSLAGAERETMSVPLTRWNTLAARLREEGLMVGGGAGTGGGWFRPRTLLQIAAALILVAGGMAAGRVTAGASMLPGGLSGRQTAGEVVPTSFGSAEEAAKWRDIHWEGYQRSIGYLASLDSSSRPVGSAAEMRTRLSALDRATQTLREALSAAPGDPVINDFYINSVAQREATLRQLTTALPPGVRLTGF